MRIDRAMQARLAVGVIRVGGHLLLLYGAVESYRRIADAEPGESTVAISEEVGSWGGGLIGGAVSSALGGAFVCAETGPGAFVCALGSGVVGGVHGAVTGRDLAHEIGEALTTMRDMVALDWYDAASPFMPEGYSEWRRDLEDFSDPSAGDDDYWSP